MLASAQHKLGPPKLLRANIKNLA